jgi:hypothetical protein
VAARPSSNVDDSLRAQPSSHFDPPRRSRLPGPPVEDCRDAALFLERTNPELWALPGHPDDPFDIDAGRSIGYGYERRRVTGGTAPGRLRRGRSATAAREPHQQRDHRRAGEGRAAARARPRARRVAAARAGRAVREHDRQNSPGRRALGAITKYTAPPAPPPASGVSALEARDAMRRAGPHVLARSRPCECPSPRIARTGLTDAAV